MNYMITGGCGFIGSHICEALVGWGEKVYIFDNLSTGNEGNISGFADRVELIKADIRDSKALESAMAGMDFVFHQAAMVSVPESVENPKDCHEVNITGTLNVLCAAKAAGVKRVVMASSCAVYGDDPALPKKEDMLPSPMSPYAASKMADEHYLKVFSDIYGLQTVGLRYFNVYGPRQDPSSVYSGVISRFQKDTKAGMATVYGDGLQTRDFVYVKDVVEANLLAMSSEKVGGGEVFNIGTGRQVSLLEILHIFKQNNGNRFKISFHRERAGDIKHSVANIKKAKKLLNFIPKTNIESGLFSLLSKSE